MVIEPAGSRSSDATRRALLEAATTAFAEHGYGGGSVRVITRAAGANQAAITYHFGGKEGLYRAVLREAVAAFEEQSFLNDHDVLKLNRVEALRLAMRQFLLPLTSPGRLGRYVRILGWEGVNPTPIYLAFFAEETPRLFRAVEQLVGRFLPPHTSRQDTALVTHWLVQQPIAFVRNAERLKAPPYNQAFDQDGIDRLVDLLTALSLNGLAQGLAPRAVDLAPQAAPSD